MHGDAKDNPFVRLCFITRLQGKHCEHCPFYFQEVLIAGCCGIHRRYLIRLVHYQPYRH